MEAFAKSKILLVDDDEAILERMRSALSDDYHVLTASSPAAAMSAYEKERPPVVMLDLSLDPYDSTDLAGMQLLEQMLDQDPSTRVIVLTGHKNDSVALRAMTLGAFDYYIKPVRLGDLKVMIDRGFHLHRLLQKARQLKQPIARPVIPGQPTAVLLAGGFVAEPTPFDVNLKSAKKAIEIDFVKKALARNHGVLSRAARDLGISRVNLYELIEKHKISPREFKRLRFEEKRPINPGEVS
jgi:DNA-binding NtrC family response regulator